MFPLCSAPASLLRTEVTLTELYNSTFLFRGLSFSGRKSCPNQSFSGEGEPARVMMRAWGQGRSGDCFLLVLSSLSLKSQNIQPEFGGVAHLLLCLAIDSQGFGGRLNTKLLFKCVPRYRLGLFAVRDPSSSSQVTTRERQSGCNRPYVKSCV